jgi:hypothetical protein
MKIGGVYNGAENFNTCMPVLNEDHQVTYLVTRLGATNMETDADEIDLSPMVQFMLTRDRC